MNTVNKYISIVPYVHGKKVAKVLKVAKSSTKVKEVLACQ